MFHFLLGYLYCSKNTFTKEGKKRKMSGDNPHTYFGIAFYSASQNLA